MLSLTYKVLTKTQSSYLHNLISIQPVCSTHSSALVTLTSSSLRITDCSFQYASPRIWNQLPATLRQPRPNHSNSDSSLPSPATSFSTVDSPLSPSITASLLSLQTQNLPVPQILYTLDFLFLPPD